MCDTQEHIGIGQMAASWIPEMLGNIHGASGYTHFLSWISPLLKAHRPAFLKLSNGASVSYGDVLGMAGDFFLEFDQLDGVTWSVKDDPQKTTHQEIDGILREYHKKLDNLAYKVGPDARPGAHFFNKWFDAGRVMNLALRNFPHFGFDALAQWLKYHNDAISLAMQGRKYYGNAAGYKKDLHVDPDPILVDAHWDTTAADYPLVNNLVVALKHNAFGDHFLSDLFSSGHMRVARRAMYDQLHDDQGNQWVVPLDHIDGSQDVDLCSIVSGIGHDEDGKIGLWCHPLFGNLTLSALAKGSLTGQVQDFMAWGDGHLFDQANHTARDLCYTAVGLSVRDLLIASATGKDPRQSSGYWDPLGGSSGPAFASLRLVPRPYPPNTGWTPDRRQGSNGYKWNHYPLAMPEGDTAKLDARFDAFKTALQKADPKAAPAEKNFFRKTKVSDPLRYLGLLGEYLSETVGTNLIPTSRPDYFDLRGYVIKGEPGWSGTPAGAWRDQEFARLMRRYIAYKMS
jgi:hypothetical protein